MSTIHDALKKVQDNMDPQDSDATPTPQEPPKPHNPFNATPPPEETVQEEPEEKQNNNTAQKIIGGIFIAIILCGLGVAIFLLTNPDRPKLLTLQKIKAAIPTKTKQQIQKPVVYPQGKIILNGIMTTGNKHVALINGEIFEIGDTVIEKQIIEITEKNITVMDAEGNEEIIKAPK